MAFTITATVALWLGFLLKKERQSSIEAWKLIIQKYR